MKIAIVGAGKLGLKVADMLTGGEHSVTVIDKDEEKLNRHCSSMDVMVVVGNGKDKALLSDIGIDTYDYLFASTDRDEKNIVIAALAKKLGAAKVIARIRDPEYMNQQELLVETFGLDDMVNPDLSVATEIYKYLAEKYTLDHGLLHVGQVSMLEFKLTMNKKLIGLTNKQIEGLLGDVVVAAISKNGKLFIPGLADEIVCDEEDFIYIIGHRDLLDSMAKKVHERGRYTDIQRIMIAGGGKSGFYLAKMLAEFGASVKVVETDKARCQYLAVHLDNVLVLHGDATDLDLLHDENLESMDAFVSCTGFDEENLLLALTAKQAGIDDVIAKISRDSYGELISKVGVDMALNPIDIEAGHIHRLMLGEKIVSSQVLQGQAEMIQVEVDEEMALIRKNLGAIKLPEDMRIAAIQRGERVIIPDEETTLEIGDRVIILALLSDTFDLEKLLKNRRGLR
jgi:trk system potassium uptake protein TrkA